MFNRWWQRLVSYWRPLPPPAVLFPEIAQDGVAQEEEHQAVDPETVVQAHAPLSEPEPVKELPICEGCGRQYDPRIRDRMRKRKLVAARARAADVVNDILTRLHALDLRHGHKWGATEEMRALDQLMGCDFYMFDADHVHEALSPGDKFGCFPIDNRETVEDLAEISWPIDQALAVHFPDNETRGEPENYMLQRVRSVTPEEARGYANMFVPKMVRHSYVKFFLNGDWYTEDNFAGLINGKWRFLDRKMSHDTHRGSWILRHKPLNDEATRNELHSAIAIVLSIALTRRYSWHVALGNTATGPRILLPTNPTGCLQFFKNRDRDEGRSRRAALRHWVARHYRERNDSGMHYVRDHLRGQTEFRWSDLACEIFVSAFDLEKNEAFKAEAHLWRSQRKHNSVRVRLKRKGAA